MAANILTSVMTASADRKINVIISLTAILRALSVMREECSVSCAGNTNFSVDFSFSRFVHCHRSIYKVVAPESKAALLSERDRGGAPFTGATKMDLGA